MMFSILIASALAGSEIEPAVELPAPAPGPETDPVPAATDRLTGVHFGLGAGIGFYVHTEEYNGVLYSMASVSSFTSLRLRLGRAFALEPTFRIARSGDAEADSEGDVGSEGHTDSYAVGLIARPRLATIDRVDLIGAVGIVHARSWHEELTGTGDTQTRETWFAAGTSATVGIALEYWITPRLSISGEAATEVFGASVYTREPDASRTTSYDMRFEPSGDMVFHLYF